MNINIKNLQRKVHLSSSELSKIKAVVRRTLRSENAADGAAITVCLTDDKLIRQFNRRFLKRDWATDVIAFNLGTGASELSGDVMISAEKAKENGKNFKTSTNYELLLYAAHGTLHILGYDDKTSGQRKLMEEKQNRILNVNP